MVDRSIRKTTTILLILAAVTWPHVAAAQAMGAASAAVSDSADSVATNLLFNPADVRIVVSVDERRLWVLVRGDTVHSAPVAVASGRTFNYAGERWRFATPRGKLRVIGKRDDPVWTPPDWAYAEVASSHNLKLRRLPASGARLRDGSRLVVRDSIVGVIMPNDTEFLALPVDEHIIFDSTLFIPPMGTHNRHLVGELGKFALDLGNGYALHGTPEKESIGTDGTHGCIRLHDEDIEWLFRHIPVGATVYVR